MSCDNCIKQDVCIYEEDEIPDLYYDGCPHFVNNQQVAKFGHWIHYQDVSGDTPCDAVYCSQCGWYDGVYETDKYCSNCGAKMNVEVIEYGTKL